MDTAANNGANMNTVAAKSSKYSARDYSCGVNTRQPQDIIGCPQIKQSLEILDGGIQNCPVWIDDALVSEYCFGKNLHSLKGKRLHKTQKITRTGFAPLPTHIISKYRGITVCADVMKFKGVHLFMSIFKKMILRRRVLQEW